MAWSGSGSAPAAGNGSEKVRCGWEATAPPSLFRELEGAADRVGGVGCPHHAVDLPRVEPHHRLAGLEREGYLRERAVLARDGDQGVGRTRNQRVARLAEPGRHGDVDEFVGLP